MIGLPIPPRGCGIDSQFEWAAHAPQATRDGVTDQVIETIRDDRHVDDLPGFDRVVTALRRQLFRERRVDLVEPVGLMTRNAATVSLLAAFDMQRPDGVAPGLPAVRGGNGRCA